MPERPSEWLIAVGVCLVTVCGLCLFQAAFNLPVTARMVWMFVLIGVISFGWPLVYTWNSREKQAERKDEAAIVAQQVTNAERQRRLDETAPTPEPEEALHTAKSAAIERFFRDGNDNGFTIDAMKGCVGSTTWAQLTDFYTSDAGRRALRVEGGKVGTVWGHGWTLDDVTRELGLGRFPLPPGDVPEVVLRPKNATKRNPERKGRAAEVVIEHRAAGEAGND